MLNLSLKRVTTHLTPSVLHELPLLDDAYDMLLISDEAITQKLFLLCESRFLNADGLFDFEYTENIPFAHDHGQAFLWPHHVDTDDERSAYTMWFGDDAPSLTIDRIEGTIRLTANVYSKELDLDHPYSVEGQEPDWLYFLPYVKELIEIATRGAE